MYIAVPGRASDIYGHITLKAPVLVRSPKLSSIEPRRYLDGRPARDAKGGEFPSFAAIFLKTCFKKQKFSLKVVKLINNS